MNISNSIRRRALDISRWQPGIDASKAKAQGISEIICRASYGVKKDALASSHASAILKHGLVLSAYSFTTAHYRSVNGGSYSGALSTAKAQANAFVSIAREIGVNGILALDVELESGQSNALNKAQLTEMCNQYMDVLAAAGYQPVLYMSASAMISWLNVDAIKYPLWVAYYYRYGTALNYDNDPSKGAFPAGNYGTWMKKYQARIAYWQFTSEGFASMYGITGSGISNATGLDKNYAYFNFGDKTTPDGPNAQEDYNMHLGLYRKTDLKDASNTLINGNKPAYDKLVQFGEGDMATVYSRVVKREVTASTISPVYENYKYEQAQPGDICLVTDD